MTNRFAVKRGSKTKVSPVNNVKKFQTIAKSRYFAKIDRKRAHTFKDCETASVNEDFNLLHQFVDTLDCDDVTKDKIVHLCGFQDTFADNVIAALTAAKAAIENSGGQYGMVEYFAALSTMLTNLSEHSSYAASVLFLLKILLPCLPRTVLTGRFSKLSELLYTTLTKYVASNEIWALRHAVICLGLLLKAQPESAWHSSSTGCMFDTLLVLVVHENIPLRRSARRAVSIILNSWHKEGAVHPASERCFQFCDSSLRKMDGDRKERCKNILQLLVHVLATFSKQNLRAICKLLLLFMSQECHEISALCMSVLDSTFRRRPSNISLPGQLNIELIRALYDCKPFESSVVLTVTWINAVTEAHVCLSHKDLSEGKVYALRWMCMLVPLLRNDEDVIVRIAAGAFGRLMRNSFSSVDAAEFGMKILRILTSTLRPVDHASLKQLRRVFETYFSIFRTSLPLDNDLKELISLLNGLYQTTDEDYLTRTFVQRVIGSIIHHMGPSVALELLPLNLDKAVPGMPADLSRLWLLKLLQRSVQNAPFQYFLSDMVPLAIRYKQYYQAAAQGDGAMFHKVYNQIWALLPSFCRNPTDLHSNGALISSTLSCALFEEPDAVEHVLSAIGILVNYPSKQRQTIAQLLANVLPSLCRAYINGQWLKATRLTMLTMVRKVSAVVSKEVLVASVEPGMKSLKRLADEKEGEEFFKLADLIAAYARQVSTDSANSIVDTLLTFQDLQHPRRLKKLYRILEEVLQNEQAVTSTEQMDALLSWLRCTPEGMSLSGRAAMYGCLTWMIKRFPVEMTSTAKELLVHAFTVGVTKSNLRLKKRCALLLFSTVDLIKGDEDHYENAVRQVYDCLISTKRQEDNVDLTIGLVLAFRFVLHRYGQWVSCHLLTDMLSRIEPLMATDSLPIVKACLQFYLTFATAVPERLVEEYLSNVLAAIFGQSESCSRRSRFKTRSLLLTMVRKFSYETIVKFVPESERARLAYVRKVVARKERRSNANNSVGTKELDSLSCQTAVDTVRGLLDGHPKDSDESDNDSVRSLTIVSDIRSTKSNRRSIRFQADDVDEVVDLLDSDLHKHILYEKERQSGAMLDNQDDNEDSDFEIADDGRIIIVEKEKRSKKADQFSDEDSETEEEEMGSSQIDTKAKSTNGRHNALEGRRGVKLLKKNSRTKAGRPGKSKYQPYAYIPMSCKNLKRPFEKSNLFKGMVGKKKKQR